MIDYKKKYLKYKKKYIILQEYFDTIVNIVDINKYINKYINHDNILNNQTGGYNILNNVIKFKQINSINVLDINNISLNNIIIKYDSYKYKLKRINIYIYLKKVYNNDMKIRHDNILKEIHNIIIENLQNNDIKKLKKNILLKKINIVQELNIIKKLYTEISNIMILSHEIILNIIKNDKDRLPSKKTIDHLLLLYKTNTKLYNSINIFLLKYNIKFQSNIYNSYINEKHYMYIIDIHNDIFLYKYLDKYIYMQIINIIIHFANIELFCILIFELLNYS